MHPFLFHIGHLQLPTFGLLAALGLMAAMSLGLRCAPMAGLEPDTVWDTTVYAVVAAFLLSRVLLIVTNFKSFLQYPLLLLAVPSLTVLGLGLTATATVLYVWWKRVPTMRLLDAWAAPGAVLWGFLALGHLAEGSDPGLPSRVAWAVRVGADPDLQQPVGLFAAVVALVLAAVLYGRLRRSHVAGMTAGTGLVLVGVAQFGLTFARQPYPYAPDGPDFVLDPIQFVAVGMLVAGGWMMAMVAVRRGETKVDRGTREVGMTAGEAL